MLPKRRKQNNNIKKLNQTLIVLVLLFLGIIIIYNRKIKTPIGSNLDKEFIIESGQGLSDIADDLKEEGLIKSKFFFKVYAKINGQQASFRSGFFDLNTDMNIKEITEELTKKNYLKPEEKLTFIEGWTLKDYSNLLSKSNLSETESFLKLTEKDYSKDFSFLKDKPKNKNLEGYLFPDTYRFFTDVSGEEVVLKMLSNFDNKLTPKMREDISSQGKTIFEIVTMASVIEKEVRSEKDMKIVSGIFWDRIKNGQALESCATLAYILGVNKPQYSYEDTRIESPYNTYINRGLPAGPIANPGIKAIEAAVYPEYTGYNYFLTASETGETIFSRTYEEHLINKNKYIK
ncbi:MAG TPA: endolytic transglycosylase MltG [bacterium]|nr:endolytic transglycosylase MltG [bacterium]